MFPGGCDYHSVEVNGTEYASVVVALIYMAAGLQNYKIVNTNWASGSEPT